MRTIIFYLSDHGFGHAARNIPIIRQLLRIESDLKIVVKTGIPQGEFIESNFKDESRIEVLKETMDIGLILKPTSFDLDVLALEAKLDDYIKSWEERIQKEVTFLNEIQPKLIVSDIVPWVFQATKQVNIKSVLISNFTWVEIYEEYLKQEIIQRYQECYDLADNVLLYDFAIPAMKQNYSKYELVSVCAREFNLDKVAKIKSCYEMPLVFVSVGRSVDLAEEIDVSNEPYHFIVTEGIQLVGENVTYLPKEVENTQDYILASQFIITKAGFGTVSEALLAKKKIAVIERPQIAEDRETVQLLVTRNLALPITYEKGLDLHNILQQLEDWIPSYEEVIIRNDSKKIAKRLLQLTENGDGHRLISLSHYGKKEMGYLVPLDEEIPFEVKRIFYLTDVLPGTSRGNHAYHETKQVLICLSGEVKVRCIEDETVVVYQLKDNKTGLYLEPQVWREVYDFSEDAVLLVLSSKAYDEGDYLR